MKTVGEPETRVLLSQAAAWRLASLLLERPRPQWRNEIAEVAFEVNERQLRLSAAATTEATEERYHALFGPGGAVSPREVSYCGMEDPGQMMARVSSFYQAFSFTPRREEPIDHIAVEAGFIGYMFLKEAYAQTQGNGESVDITREARARFLKEHLHRCAQGMVHRLDTFPAYLGGVLSWIAALRGDCLS